MTTNTGFRRALQVATAMAAAEVLMVTSVTLRHAPPDAALYAGLLWSLVKSAPLLVLLPGLVRGSRRSAVWLCYVLCPYFVAAAAGAVGPGSTTSIFGLEFAVLIVGFVAGLLAARWGRGQPEPTTRMS